MLEAEAKYAEHSSDRLAQKYFTFGVGISIDWIFPKLVRNLFHFFEPLLTDLNESHAEAFKFLFYCCWWRFKHTQRDELPNQIICGRELKHNRQDWISAGNWSFYFPLTTLASYGVEDNLFVLRCSWMNLQTELLLTVLIRYLDSCKFVFVCCAIEFNFLTLVDFGQHVNLLILLKALLWYFLYRSFIQNNSLT